MTQERHTYLSEGTRSTMQIAASSKSGAVLDAITIQEAGIVLDPLNSSGQQFSDEQVEHAKRTLAYFYNLMQRRQTAVAVGETVELVDYSGRATQYRRNGRK